jgi:iron complex transport system permease protein
LPITVLTGAAFLVLTDTLARTIMAPSELPVGILMAFVGGPFFLYLLRRTKRGYGS